LKGHHSKREEEVYYVADIPQSSPYSTSLKTIIQDIVKEELKNSPSSIPSVAVTLGMEHLAEKAIEAKIQEIVQKSFATIVEQGVEQQKIAIDAHVKSEVIDKTKRSFENQQESLIQREVAARRQDIKDQTQKQIHDLIIKEWQEIFEDEVEVHAQKVQDKVIAMRQKLVEFENKSKQYNEALQAKGEEMAQFQNRFENIIREKDALMTKLAATNSQFSSELTQSSEELNRRKSEIKDIEQMTAGIQAQAVTLGKLKQEIQSRKAEIETISQNIPKPDPKQLQRYKESVKEFERQASEIEGKFQTSMLQYNSALQASQSVVIDLEHAYNQRAEQISKTIKGQEQQINQQVHQQKNDIEAKTAELQEKLTQSLGKINDAQQKLDVDFKAKHQEMTERILREEQEIESDIQTRRSALQEKVTKLQNEVSQETRDFVTKSQGMVTLMEQQIRSELFGRVPHIVATVLLEEQITKMITSSLTPIIEQSFTMTPQMQAKFHKLFSEMASSAKQTMEEKKVEMVSREEINRLITLKQIKDFLGEHPHQQLNVWSRFQTVADRTVLATPSQYQEVFRFAEAHFKDLLAALAAKSWSLLDHLENKSQETKFSESPDIDAKVKSDNRFLGGEIDNIRDFPGVASLVESIQLKNLGDNNKLAIRKCVWPKFVEFYNKNLEPKRTNSIRTGFSNAPVEIERTDIEYGKFAQLNFTEQFHNGEWELVKTEKSEREEANPTIRMVVKAEKTEKAVNIRI